MSEPGTFNSIDKLMAALNAFVNTYKEDAGMMDNFSIKVFLGRGVHEFEYDNQESNAAAKVHDLKKQLEQAEKELDAQRKKQAKRVRDE